MMPPKDSLNLLVIRNGECSGNFALDDVVKETIVDR